MNATDGAVAILVALLLGMFPGLARADRIGYCTGSYMNIQLKGPQVVRSGTWVTGLGPWGNAKDDNNEHWNIGKDEVVIEVVPLWNDEGNHLVGLTLITDKGNQMTFHGEENKGRVPVGPVPALKLQGGNLRIYFNKQGDGHPAIRGVESF